MTTKDNKKQYASNVGPSDPVVECGPGTHWDEASQSCVPDAQAQGDVMIYAETISSDGDGSEK